MDKDGGLMEDNILTNDINGNSFANGDIIPATPEIQKTNRPKIFGIDLGIYLWNRQSRKWKCSAGPYIHEAQSAAYMSLKNPVCPTITKTYVYHSFRKLLNYNSEKYPVNNYMKLMGQYKISHSNIPYVQGLDYNDREYTIFLNMRMLEKLPKLNEAIEIFGHLDFRSIMNKDVPIIVVHFFSPMNGDILKYAYYLSKQIKFVPESCLQLKQETEKYHSSLLDYLQDLSLTIISMDDQ